MSKSTTIYVRGARHLEVGALIISALDAAGYSIASNEGPPGATAIVLGAPAAPVGKDPAPAARAAPLSPARWSTIAEMHAEIEGVALMTLASSAAVLSACAKLKAGANDCRVSGFYELLSNAAKLSRAAIAVLHDDESIPF
jgi:hypothetical protein